MSIPVINAKLLIAISFDKRTEAILKTVLELFKNSPVEITLVHVLTNQEDISIHHPTILPIEAIHSALRDEAKRTAYLRLERLASTLRQSLEVKTKVLHGGLAETLMEYAKINHLDMIVLGTTKMKRLSTALSIIAKNSLPILIIHEDSNLLEFSNEHRILIADDLLLGGRIAVNWAYKLANMLTGANILHCHIIEPGELKSRLEDMQLPSSLTKVDADSVIRTIKNKVANTLCERFKKEAFSLTVNGEENYDVEVVIGDSRLELERSATAFRSDLAVFSAHKIYHRENKEGGCISLSSMIDNQRVVMVVPNDE